MDPPAPAPPPPASSSTGDDPASSNQDKPYPEWLPTALRSPHAPSVALAFYNGDSAHPRVLPLFCVFPKCVLDSPAVHFATRDYAFDHLSSRFVGYDHGSETPNSQSPALPHKEASWASTSIPVEVFDEIIKHMSQKDAKKLRLVNREFERGVSRALFRSVVVPFSLRTYQLSAQAPGTQAAGNAKETTHPKATVDIGSNWEAAFNLKDEDSPRRFEVFKNFGSCIRRFGMTFEVNPEQIRNLIKEKAMEIHNTFWGAYEWPSRGYRRTKELSRLEDLADETSYMKTAFSYLVGVKHLALSIDSGLGWMNGPDKSIRSVILQTPSMIFPALKYENSESSKLSQRQLWELIEEAYEFAGAKKRLRSMELRCLEDVKATSTLPDQWLSAAPSLLSVPFGRLSLQLPVLDMDQPLDGAESAIISDYQSMISRNKALTRYNEANLSLIENLAETLLEEADGYNPVGMDAGILCTAPITVDMPDLQKQSLVSGNCMEEQLLETAWAQDAFLSSYVLAVEGFSNVSMLTLAKLSSRFIHKFLRADFWASLPLLSSLSIRIIPDWLDVEVDKHGVVSMPEVRPSEAIGPYQSLLGDFIAKRTNITTLSLGWADGGERAEGMRARNNHLLPVPFLEPTLDSLQKAVTQVSFPHVRFLTLENCWITPEVAVDFVVRHMGYEMSQITLESISLTGRLEALTRAQPPQAATALNQAPMSTHQLRHQTVNAAALQLLTLQPPPHFAYRNGSWSHVLQRIQAHCGANNMSGPAITFRSCGYARVREKWFDESALRDLTRHPAVDEETGEPEEWINRRRVALAANGIMPRERDQLHGEIVTALPVADSDALKRDWGFNLGWPTKELLDDGYDDEDGYGKYGEKTKEAAVYDGNPKGGSGRFSGRIAAFWTGETSS